MNCDYCDEDIPNKPRQYRGLNFHPPSLLRDCLNEFLKQEQQRQTTRLQLAERETRQSWPPLPHRAPGRSK